MKSLLFLTISLCTLCLTIGRTTTPRRPQCICTGRMTAIMQDRTGTYCVYFGPDGTKQWRCENQDEWDDYHAKLARKAKEPRCHCTGDVTAIMQDETGTYCVFYNETENKRWECENHEEWKLYRNEAY